MLSTFGKFKAEKFRQKRNRKKTIKQKEERMRGRKRTKE